MEKFPLVSVVIPTHNRKEKLLRLIDSIKKSKYPKNKIEIIVIDDASTDGTYEAVKEHFPEVKILRNQKELYPSACRNQGIKNAHGKYIFFIDDDNILHEDTIYELVKFLERNKQVGIAGPITYYYAAPSKIWCAGAKINPPFFAPTHIFQGASPKNLGDNWFIECDYIPNAYMIRRDVVYNVGLFDERLPIGWEEIDFALRVIKKDYKVVVFNRAKIFHDIPFERDIHITRHRAYWRGRNRVIFYKKHAPIRCIFIFIDIIGFILSLLTLRKTQIKSLLFSYLKGINDGLKISL